PPPRPRRADLRSLALPTLALRNGKQVPAGDQARDLPTVPAPIRRSDLSIRTNDDEANEKSISLHPKSVRKLSLHPKSVSSPSPNSRKPLNPRSRSQGRHHVCT